MRPASSAAAIDTPNAAAAATAATRRAPALTGSAARLPSSRILPERRLLPARLRQAPPRLVEVRVREEDGDHLLAVAVPEPESPRRHRAGLARGLEEGCPRHPTDAGQLGAGSAAM